MIPEILEIENDRVVISVGCLTVPELKAIVDYYGKDAVAVLTYIRHLTHPKSPYCNEPEETKEELIRQDVTQQFDVAFNFKDPLIQAAIDKIETLFPSVTRRFYMDNKIGIEKIGKYLREQDISTGRDGNDKTFLAMQKSAGEIYSNFKKLEKQYEDELSELRGGQEASYDEED